MRVFVTGATSGIGAALARHYAAGGATLGLTGRRTAELERLRAALGVPCEIYPGDVADASFMKLAARDFVARHGVPDVVIANAGISVGTLGGDEASIPTLDRVLRTNVVGLAATLEPFIEPMRSAGRGSLVGIASVAGIRGLPGSGAYSASKSAVITWMESLRTELAGSGVRVTTICPGWIATPMTAVNAYPMPFTIEADEFARRAARVIAGGRRFVVIPWQMAIVARILRVMPAWLFDLAVSRFPRKRRDLPH